MGHFIPTERAGETCTNVRHFVEMNSGEMWKILKTLAPYIAGLYFFDAIVSTLFFEKGGTGFFLGSIVASYFYICLIISWLRFVITGAEGYKPMNPLSPQDNEISFIVVGLVIWIAVSLVMQATYSHVGIMKMGDAIFLGIPLIVIMFSVSVYAAYRFWYFFPAKAVDAQVTLMEAFKKSGGCLWHLVYASFLASLKTIVILIAYYLAVWVFGMVMYLMLSAEMNGYFINYLFYLPVYVYFKPLLIVFGATAVSNYYLYVLQGSKEEASESVADDVSGEG